MDGQLVGEHMRTGRLTIFCLQLLKSSERAPGARTAIENSLWRPIALVQCLHVSWHAAGVEGEWQMQSAQTG